MRKTVGGTLGALALVIGVAAPAAAATTLGPYAGASADSGTCGNNWANDTYLRTFTVGTPTASGTPVTELFTNGRFTAVAGKSPGACQAGGDNGGTVAAGIQGTFSGSESGIVTCAGTCVVNSNPDVTPCALTAQTPTNSTACFITAIFGATASFPGGPTFKFNYTANCGQPLVLRQWQNADAASGGNVGDIESTQGNVASGARTSPSIFPCPTTPLPPTTGVHSDPVVPNTILIVLAGLGVLAIAGAFSVRARLR